MSGLSKNWYKADIPLLARNKPENEAHPYVSSPQHSGHTGSDLETLLLAIGVGFQNYQAALANVTVLLRGRHNKLHTANLWSEIADAAVRSAAGISCEENETEAPVDCRAVT